MIDAAEFVGPYQDRRLGLHKAAKYYHTTGWHESSTVTELIINKAAWESLPTDLREIIRAAAGACKPSAKPGATPPIARRSKILSPTKASKLRRYPPTSRASSRKRRCRAWPTTRAKTPLVKKVHDSYMAFKKGWDKWAAISEGVYHSQIRGQI